MDTGLIILSKANLQRAAWSALLEGQPGLVVLGATGEVERLESWLPTDGPTTILIDLPTIDPKFVRQVHTTMTGAGLLFLVEEYTLAEIVRLLKGGAAGFITRDSEVSDLARAIIAAGRGEIVLPASLASKALVALARGEASQESAAVESLTEREQEVLGLLAQGLTNKDIAQTLILSVRTVEAHLRNIYGKLGVASRTEAALWAVNHEI